MPEYKTKEQKKSNQYYDKYKRDSAAKRFYNSKMWRIAREKVLIRDNYLCQSCLKQGIIATAHAVHHIKEYKEHPELALEETNLEAICKPCHNKQHPEKGMSTKPKKKSNKIKVIKASANKEEI